MITHNMALLVLFSIIGLALVATYGVLTYTWKRERSILVVAGIVLTITFIVLAVGLAPWVDLTVKGKVVVPYNTTVNGTEVQGTLEYTEYESTGLGKVYTSIMLVYAIVTAFLTLVNGIYFSAWLATRGWR